LESAYEVPLKLEHCQQKNLMRICRLVTSLNENLMMMNTRPVLLKLWAAAWYRAAEVWLPGRGLTPKFVFCTIREYGTAFMLTLSLKISYG